MAVINSRTGRGEGAEVLPRARAAGGNARVTSRQMLATKKPVMKRKGLALVAGKIRQSKKSNKSVQEDQLALPNPCVNLPAIVISLARRPDRMAGCAARLTAHCPGLTFNLFNATDGKATPIGECEVTRSWNTARNVVYQKRRAIRKGWDDLDTYQVRQLDLSAGERGCASSHIRAWRHCLENAGNDGKRPLLVLEDDAAPTADFVPTLARALAALPSDAHILYLGYSQAAEWRREISPELVESEYVWTTVGYIIWPEGARLLLNQLPVNEPVDNWLAAHCAGGDLKAYCVRPKVINQADAWNVNSDVGHSDEHYWGPNSDISHSDALYWGPESWEAQAARANGELPAASGPLAGGSCFWDIGSDDDSEEDSIDL